MKQVETDIPVLLPKIEALPGAVHLQSVKCGKVNCRCAHGSPHKAYYRFWREGKKIKKAYVRKADVERVRQACKRFAESNRMLASVIHSPAGDKVRREIRAMLRSAGATETTIRRMTR